MRGSRSLGLALVAAALGVAPAMAQQSNTGAAPANTPPAARSGMSAHNGAAMPGATNPNEHAGSTTAANDQAKPAAGNANAAPTNTAANNNQSSGANSAPAPAPNAANNVPPASGNATQAPAATTANTMPPATETNKPAPANTVAATNPPAERTTTANKGPSGSLQKYNGEWRSSKLVGATVYNEHGDDIGKIDDLLMDDHGKIETVVVSTGGGVLGIGAKLVSVPFDQIKFEPSVNNTTPATAGAPGGNRSANSTAEKAEYSVVLPGATEKSLSQQSTFKYASTD